MALNAFALSGGVNLSVGPTPICVQVTGPTLVLTNVGIGGATVYGSCGGSGSSALNFINGFISGQPVGGTGAGASNANPGMGIAIPPLGWPVVISTGGNGYLWLATLGGQASVNIANGT